MVERRRKIDPLVPIRALSRLEVGACAWVLAPDAPPGLFEDVCVRLDAYRAGGSGTLIKENRVRSVFRTEVAGQGVYLKRYRIQSGKDRLKHLFWASKAWAEWTALRAFTERELPTARPLAVMERKERGLLSEAALVTLEIEGALGFHAAIRHMEDLPEAERRAARTRFFQGIGRIARGLHAEGYLHRDLHGGNFLYRPADEALFILDLHKVVHLPVVPRWMRAWELGFLLFALETFTSPEERLALFEAYTGEPAAARSLLDESLAWALKHAGTRRKSRDRRCLLSSTVYEVEQEGSFRVFRRRDVEMDAIRRAIEAAREAGPIPADRRSRVARVQVGGAPILVKSYPGGIRATLQESRARRAWRLGHAFLERGLPTPRPLACVEDRSFGYLRASHLLTEWIEGARDLPAHLRQTSQAEARKLHELARKLGRLFRDLHASGVYHNDTKGPNILVRDGPAGPDLFWVDLDGATTEGLTFRRRLKNLAALARHFRTFGPEPKLTFALGFLGAYDPEGDKREYLVKIEELVRAKLEA